MTELAGQCIVFKGRVSHRTKEQLAIGGQWLIIIIIIIIIACIALYLVTNYSKRLVLSPEAYRQKYYFNNHNLGK